MPAALSSSPPVVWIVTLPASMAAESLGRCLALLDDDERARAAAFKIEPPRRQYIVAHALLRMLMSTITPVSPADWRFGRGEYGKPFVSAPAVEGWLEFSLSHTAGVVAAAVSTSGAIGLDVQAVDRDVDMQHFRQCLAATELAELSAVPGNDRDDRFYALWAAKEAVTKAVGTGVSEAMAGIEFVATGGHLKSRSADARYEGWHVAQGVLPTCQRYAVATRSPNDATPQIFRLDEWLTTIGI